MLKIDLNCDLGEGFGSYNMGQDADIIPLITSANIACGAHASDPIIMSRTVAMCKAAGVAVGAHPGFFDLMGFGRRNIDVTPAEAKAYVQYQMGALQAFCTANNMRLSHIKPHGALYNMAGKDIDLALAICEGIKEIDNNLILLGLSGSKMLDAAKKIGLRAACEVFADRGYEEDGSLVKRGKAGAMITNENEAVERVVRMVTEGKVRAVSGKDINIKADSVCVHGDGEKALEFVKKISKALCGAGVKLCSLNEIV
ncbi:MAG: 5-oxoprolinase subunit PxpA [Clostridia bacterium]